MQGTPPETGGDLRPRGYRGITGLAGPGRIDTHRSGIEGILLPFEGHRRVRCLASIHYLLQRNVLSRANPTGKNFDSRSKTQRKGTAKIRFPN